MSTIKLEFEITASNAKLVAEFLTNLEINPCKQIEVVDPEEVKADLLPKSGKPRPSRAKAKPAPVEEGTEDEELEDEAPAQDDELEDETEEDEAITIEDIRTEQARTITKHRAALIEQYKKLDAKGISSLDEKHYKTMYDFMSKLK